MSLGTDNLHGHIECMDIDFPMRKQGPICTLTRSHHNPPYAPPKTSASATLANEISEDGYDDFGRKIVSGVEEGA